MLGLGSDPHFQSLGHSPSPALSGLPGLSDCTKSRHCTVSWLGGLQARFTQYEFVCQALSGGMRWGLASIHLPMNPFFSTGPPFLTVSLFFLSHFFVFPTVEGLTPFTPSFLFVSYFSYSIFVTFVLLYLFSFTSLSLWNVWRAAPLSAFVGGKCGQV